MKRAWNLLSELIALWGVLEMEEQEKMEEQKKKNKHMDWLEICF